MTIFDLVFLLGFFASVVTLLTAAVFSFRGRGAQALKTVIIWAACAAVYLGISVTVDYLKPQRIIAVGEPWCFDDWCLTVEKVSGAPPYATELRLSSRALRVSQRALNAWIYLIDERGRLYPPDPDPSAVPLDVRLEPGESVTTSRVFRVPTEVHELGLVTGHGGGHYCGIGSILIIGEGGCLFNKPTMVLLR